jgi:hypothetical protein
VYDAAAELNEAMESDKEANNGRSVRTTCMGMTITMLRIISANSNMTLAITIGLFNTSFLFE